ncbi:T9SS type A sorting domain-containing protein [Jejudonia soesokkakensis]|uniref:T9SS type A sorting domain-containing protein n=1 Tax=Jejudonia soesokkakensis TaxID=1323432 RepID=A0ABW2MT97_9FLAO
MKFSLTFLSLFIFLFSATSQVQDYQLMIDQGTFSVEEIVTVGEAYFENRDKGKGSGYKQFKRWEYMAKRLMNDEGYLTPDSERIETLKAYNVTLNNNQQRQLLQDNWTTLGPVSYNATSGWNPGVGRITGVAVDLTNTDIIIIGGETGGVWRTADGGQNWTPLGDNFVNLRVYSVAIDPNNPTTYFFGSSSGLIYKSVDSGSTWTEIADVSNSLINKILIHPTNSDIMFASSQNVGLFRTIDGGDTWTEVTNDTRSYDVEFKADDTNIVYASGSSYHKSTDGGATFTTMNTGFNSGPKMIAVSPDDAEIVYVLQAFNGGFSGLFKSLDGGDSFSQLSHSGRNFLNLSSDGTGGGGQAPRDMDIVVHPTNIDEVHLGGGQTWRSLDGGVTFQLSSFWFLPDVQNFNVGYCHADIDFMQYFNGEIYVGSDGGVFKTPNSSGPINVSYFEDLTDGLGIRQFYKIGIAQGSEQKITGGSQDNGSSVYTEGTGWKDWLGADGGDGFIGNTSNNTIFGTTQFGRMYRSSNGGNTASNVNLPTSSPEGNFVPSFEKDPVDNSIYIAYNRIYKSLNSGSNWTAISQTFSSPLDDFKIAPTNNQIIYGANGGAFYRTEDGGATDWVQMTSPGGSINSIAVHPSNPNKVAVATTNSNRVFVSEDGGQSWTSMRFNLPNFSALSVVWDDNGQDGLYVGMDYGIFYIDNRFSDWQPYSNLLPNVIINELEINVANGLLYAATYGRGLWVSPTVNTLLSVDDSSIEDAIVVYPNPANDEISLSLRNPLDGEIRIFDISGKLVLFEAKETIVNNHQINIAALKSGTYFIRLNTESGTVTKKLIKN